MAFKMKNTAYYKKKFAESEMSSPYNKNSNDDDVLSKEIKDTRELSDKAQEKYRRGAIGPEESPEVIAKKEEELKKSIDTANDKFDRKSIDIATEKAKEYGEAYSYKKDPGKKLKK